MEVTVVITSFNRIDLLEKTVNSFNQYNTYPIKEFIIVEDSGNRATHEILKKLYPDYTLILNEHNIGLVESIDNAYSQVRTSYVFHSEDDYEYYRVGFIERSLAVLENDPKLMQVWIRRMDDTTDMPIEPELFRVGDVGYYLIGHCINNWWHGFCFQCGLRKMSAYDRVKPYTQWSPPSDFLSQRECKIGQAYYALGYRAAILPEGYAGHTGFGRSTCGNQNL